MKSILFLLLTSTFHLFITFASTANESIMDGKLITKSYPRKLKKVQIINPRKFLTIKSSEYKHNVKKLVARSNGYTIFPTVAQQRGEPESLLFNADHIEPKIRVKKVLPDYLFSVSRKKRELSKYSDVDNIKRVTTKTIKKKKEKKDHNKDKNEKVKDSSKTKTKKSDSHAKIENTDTKRKSNKNDYTTNKNASRAKRKHIEREQNGEDKIQKKNNQMEKKQKKKLRHGKRRHVKESRRLIAGKDAMIADYPYVVSIQKDGEHWCAGALLNPRLVITTANCIWKATRISRMRVRAGSRHTDRGGQRAKIQEVMKHPRWSIRGGPDNDVALVLLDRNLRFSNSIHGVDLPNYAMMPDFEDAWVTSWGAERRDGIYRSTQVTLQVFHARLLDQQKCNNVTQRFGVTVSENFICLAQTGRRAPCTRDTGAPAVSDGVLWGLASWGLRKLCGTERFPAMFSYTASPDNLQFIKNATSYLMSEQRFYPFPDRYQVDRANPTTPTTTTTFEYRK